MARRVTACRRCGLVQVIRLRWTKSARGGEGARARSAVPLSFEVHPDAFAGAEEMLCAEVTDRGEREFAEPFATDRLRVPLADGLTLGCVSVAAAPEGLSVRFEYSRPAGGAPDRWPLNVPAGLGQTQGRTMAVRDGEWARVRYNGRFSCTDSGNWWYEQTTANVAWFEGEPDPRVFLDREPAAELSALADLW